MWDSQILLEEGVEVDLQFRALVEPQQQLAALRHHRPLSRRRVLRLQVNLFVKLYLSRDLGLILVAGSYLEIVLLAPQYNLVFNFLFLLFVNGNPQVLSGNLVPQID
jgi:hypothetical protein